MLLVCLLITLASSSTIDASNLKCFTLLEFIDLCNFRWFCSIPCTMHVYTGQVLFLHFFGTWDQSNIVLNNKDSYLHSELSVSLKVQLLCSLYKIHFKHKKQGSKYLKRSSQTTLIIQLKDQKPFLVALNESQRI